MRTAVHRATNDVDPHGIVSGVTKKAKPAPQLKAVVEEDEEAPAPPQARLKRLTKGKRKAEPDPADDEPPEGQCYIPSYTPMLNC